MTDWWPFTDPPPRWAQADVPALAGELRAMEDKLLSAPDPDPRETWLADAANAVHEALRAGERPACLSVLAWDADGEAVMVTVGGDGSVRREAGRGAAG